MGEGMSVGVGAGMSVGAGRGMEVGAGAVICADTTSLSLEIGAGSG